MTGTVSVSRQLWETPSPETPTRWELLRGRIQRLNQVSGMRTAGWICLGIGVVVLVLGAVLNWTEVKVAGVMGIALVGIALLFTLGRPSLSVALRSLEHAVVQDAPAFGEIQVRNLAARRHLSSRLEFQVGPTIASLAVVNLRQHEPLTKRFAIPTRRRGLMVIGPAKTVQGDPFRLTGRVTQWTGQVELYVHPKTVSLPGRQTGFTHDLEGHPSAHISVADMSFHALRPYVAGDDRRHVHWRSTARAGELMVRQFEESRMSQVLLALDTGREAWLDDDEFELGVSCAASLASQAILGESPLQLLTSTAELIAVTRSRALDQLATVELTQIGGLSNLVQGALVRDAGASIAMFVTGSIAPLASLLRAGARFDVDTRVVGLRVEVGAELRVSSSGNITVIQVGDLAELPRGIRKAME